MSTGFLLMAITVSVSVAVYCLWVLKYGLNENAGLLLSTLTAVLFGLVVVLPVLALRIYVVGL